jgi:multidrug efflux pump subunit AcrA (membrane-fusion protein)
MGFWDIFKRQQPPPQQIAPRVDQVQPMTCHGGQVINADLLLWIVHYRMIDTATYGVIFDKYYEEETEASARRLYNQLKSQPLKSDCITAADYWGEHKRQDFQKAVDEIRLKLKAQYEQDLQALAHKQAQRQDKQVRLHDKHLQELYQLREDYKKLCAEYDRQQTQHQQEISTIMQAQHEQIETETAQAVEQATASIQAQLDRFKQEAQEAGNNLLRVLTSDPDEQAQEVKRLRKRLRQAGIEAGPAQLQLIAYYLAPLFTDTD